MSKFKIRHLTKYTYESPVRDSANQIILYPVKDVYQEVLSHTIQVSGNPVIKNHIDFYGNEVGTFMHVKPHHQLTIDSTVYVATKRRPLPNDRTSPAEQWEQLYKLEYQIPYLDFLKTEKFDALPEIQQMIRETNHETQTPISLAKHFSKYIYNNFTYQKGITTIETTLDEIWRLRSGVCQDFAHLLLAILRQMHIPARYVSGYICPHKNGMRGEGATHAWVELYIPNYGWLGIDPTNNCIANETHVRLAVGKNFSDCSPVKGTYHGDSNHSLEVGVSIEYEDGLSEQGTVSAQAEPAVTYTQNSFRRHQEMQMQQ